MKRYIKEQGSIMMDDIKEMIETDVWEDVNLTQFSMDVASEELEKEKISLAREEQVETAILDNEIVLLNSTSGYLMHEGAMRTVKERLGISCKAVTGYEEKKKKQKICDIANICFPDAGKATLLIRNGKLAAAHSNSYAMISQYDAFTALEEDLNENYPLNEFIYGEMDIDYSSREYRLEGPNGPMLRSYRKTWEEEGFDLRVLPECYPKLRMVLGDTGLYQIALYPILQNGRKEVLLAPPLTVKHRGKNDLENLKEALPKVYAAARAGIDASEKLIEKKLDYPVEAFVAASKKAGLTKLCKKALLDCFETFELSARYLAPGTKLSAYAVFSSISDIEYTSHYQELKDEKKISIKECLARLLLSDWDEFDRPGSIEF